MRRNNEPFVVSARRISIPHRYEEPDVYLEEVGEQMPIDPPKIKLGSTVYPSEIIIPPNKKKHAMMPTPSRWGVFRSPLPCTNIDFDPPNPGSETGLLTSLLKDGSFDHFTTWMRLTREIGKTVSAIKQGYYDDFLDNEHAEAERVGITEPFSDAEPVQEAGTINVFPKTAANPVPIGLDLLKAFFTSMNQNDK